MHCSTHDQIPGLPEVLEHLTQGDIVGVLKEDTIFRHLFVGKSRGRQNISMTLFLGGFIG
jgi:hypothetical protein